MPAEVRATVIEAEGTVELFLPLRFLPGAVPLYDKIVAAFSGKS